MLIIQSHLSSRIYGVGIEPISYWATWEASDYYVHADHHEILFDESNPGRIYFGHDGGVSRRCTCPVPAENVPALFESKLI